MRSAPWILVVALTTSAPGSAGQAPQRLPLALEQSIATDRAFHARAIEVGWTQASREFLAPDAITIDEAGARLANQPLEPGAALSAGERRTWEVRYGDSATSGDLAYLIGPLQDVSADGDRPRHGLSLRVWKRQRNSTFRVVLDAVVPTPGPATFPDGFTAAPHANRFEEYDDTTPPLGTADGLLNAGLRTDQARAYRTRLAEGARFLRPNRAPLLGERQILQWLASQGALRTVDTRYSESARSGDLGYAWGAYTGPAQGAGARGYYVRVWTRERSGQWNVTLDLLQPATRPGARGRMLPL